MGKNLLEELKRIHSITYGDLNENLQGKLNSILSEATIESPSKVKHLFNILEDAARKGGISQQQKGKYTYSKSVEALQIALMMIGYKFPLRGADGLYGPETAKAVRLFKEDFSDLNLTEASSELRNTLSDLGYEEKSGQLTSGGDISDGLSGIVSQILKDFKKEKPTIKVRVTAGNDAYHKKLSYKSKHSTGQALDVVLLPYNNESSNAFINVLKKYKSRDSKFNFIDEYKKKSKGWTGGHFHLEYSGTSSKLSSSGEKNILGSKNVTRTSEGEFISPDEIRLLIKLLQFGGVDDSDLEKFKGTTFSLREVSDSNFYKKFLQVIGAPISDENLKLLYAWRQSEGKAGKYNPFNTTYPMAGATNFNKVGVKNYLSYEDGLIATIRTLKNGRYDCIVNGLINDLGADRIATCKDFQKWGTGVLIRKVVDSYNRGADPNVPRLV